MFGGMRTGRSLFWIGVFALTFGVSVRAEIDLEWRSRVIGGSPDEIVEVGLYAVSDTGFDQSFSAMSVLISWDPAHLELIGFTDPCTVDPCPFGTYNWIQLWFPDDSKLSGINDDITDGDAFFQALGQLGLDNIPYAPFEGLHVTSFRFRVLALGSSEVAIETQIGETRTRIAGGEFPGLEVTGVLGPPAQVIARVCDDPTVVALGGRYFSVTPADGSDPIALRVMGDEAEPTQSCLDAYVQSDGSLGATPFYQLPDEWATVSVFGEAIGPLSLFSVVSDCTEEQPGIIQSQQVDVTTWRWGDTNGDGLVGLSDITRVIDSASGELPPNTLLEAVDLVPCQPDGVVTQDDVDAVVAAFSLNPFPCAAPCVVTTLDDLPAFLDCFGGPFFGVDEICDPFDFDSDGDVDTEDYAVFERRLIPSGP